MEKQRSQSYFNCFICSQPFSSRHTLNKGGKVPLVLQCGHSACDSCISRLVNTPGVSLVCDICNAVSTTSEYYNPAKPELEFPLNTIILGQLVLKSQSGWDDNKISFSMPSKMQSSPRAVNCHECVERRAECNCVQCQVPYCGSCFNKVHQSARCFKDHIRSDIIDSENIEVKCSIHKDLSKQFWCDLCSVAACTNCLISTHNGHTISLLSDKNLACFRDLMSSYVNICNVQNRLKATRKRMTLSLSKQENNACKEAEKEIREHFSKLHGLLIAKENKLLNKLYTPYRGAANSLKNMLQQVDTTIEDLDQVLKMSGSLIQYDKKYLNCASYADVLEKLRTREVTPCYLLVSQENQSSSKFTVIDDTISSIIETHCDIETDINMPIYRLVTEGDLPPDYQIEPIKSVSLDSLQLMSSLAANTQTDLARTPSPSVSIQSLDSASNTEQKVASDINPTPEPISNRNFDDLVEGCKVSVTVTHAISPNDFYIRRLGLEKRLKEINELFSQIKCNLKTPTLKRIFPGEHFMAQYSQDNQWYRSVALGVEDNLVTVFYIDFGNKESVKVDKLKLMPGNLMKNDGMAIRCSLHQCQPARGVWLPQALSTMLKIIKGPSELYVIVKKKGDNLLHVDLARTDSLDEVNLRQALIFLGYAESTDPSCPAMKVDTVTNQRAFYSYKPFPSGHIIEATITHCVSPFKFYARDIKNNSNFTRLSSGLKEMYGKKGSFENMVIYHPKKGMIVAALNNQNNQWRRAKIIDVLEGSMVEVYYLDYGNSEVIPYKRIRYLGHKFYKIALQCFSCSLLDIAPLAGENSWNQKALGTFAKLLQGNTQTSSVRFQIVVHSYRDEQYHVVLYKNLGDLCLSINSALVGEKVAVSTGANSTLLHIPSKCSEDNSDSQVYMQYMRSEKDIILKDDASIKGEKHQSKKKNSAFNHDLSSRFSSVTQLSRLPDVVGDQGSYHRDDDSPQGLSSKESESIKVPVTIVKVVSPSEFYITPVTMLPKLKIMKRDMQQYYNKKGASCKMKEPTENTVCVIKKELEEDWCRAFIVKINESTVEVLLPDFGDKLEVSKDSIYCLAEKFQDLRDGATRCHLGGLKQPLDDRWPMTSTDEIVEFGEKYEGKIYITKLGQERANSMPVEVLMKEEKAAGALEPMKVTWTSLNNSLRMRGLALSDGTIDWDLEDYKFVSIQHHIPKLQMDIFKGIPIKYTSLTDNSEIIGADEIKNVESVFGSTVKSEGVASEINDDTSATDDDIIRSTISSSCNTLESITVEDPEEQVKIIHPELPLAMPAPIMPKAWPDPLPFSKLEFIANPTNVNYEASIFMQEFQKSASILRKIGDILDSHCCLSLPMPHDMYWSVGQTCVTRYHLDKKWYRGVVEEIREDNTLSVRLVDYGNKEDCSVEDLRKMPLATDIPIQGQFCKIKKLKPNSSDGKWPIPILDKMHAIVVEKHCLVQLSIDPSDNGYLVENVKLPDGSEMLSLVVREGNAFYNDPDVPTITSAIDEPVITPQDSQTISAEENSDDDLVEVLSEIKLSDSRIAQQPETLMKNDSHIAQQPETLQESEVSKPPGLMPISWAAEVEAYAEASEMAVHAVEEERRRQHLQSNSDSESSNHASDDAYLQADDGILDDSPFGYLYSVIPQNLETFEVEVTSLVQPDTVVFQITDSNDLKSVNSREKFLELTDDLQVEAAQEPVVTCPRLNGLCCAKYSVDNTWYRAMIIDIPDKEHVLVKYVDYGNMELLPLSQIREMREMWAMVEVQSFEAKLHNVLVAVDLKKDGSRCKYSLEKALYGQKLTAKVIRRDPLTVELYNGNFLAYQSLIDSGLLKLDE